MGCSVLFRQWVVGRAIGPGGRRPPYVQVGDEMRRKGMPWVLRHEDSDKVSQRRFSLVFLTVASLGNLIGSLGNLI